ncbi:MAG: hypothetical protein CMQ46_01690 [Gammaproteobacteria bacterium]|nr:hypothetical protein [Gammaproteobacteria bacterium]MBJ53960.1 hypothetical protein [Gammaproteobacteria bacterium]HBN14094.1 hypothetical protein [Pseudohongiella sp.]|tara:strand:+ start:2198 stop:3151 length:954 start_codon:yes stop_codon:yes gene_type:complete
MPAKSTSSHKSPVSSYQTGVGLLIFFIVLFSVAATVTLSALNNRIAARTDNNTVYPELLEAKEALLAFAMFHTGLSANDNGPGRLPCPDTNNDKFSNNDCDDNSTIGRLPVEYSFPALKSPADFVFTTRNDDSRFWYALSEGFGFDPSTPTPALNTSTESTLTLNGQDDIVALIIDAGVAVGTQTRPNNNRANYLEGGNQLGTDFVTVPPTLGEFNDRMVAITEAELRAAMTLRVAQSIRQVIVENSLAISSEPELQAAMTNLGPSWYSPESWNVSDFNEVSPGIITFEFANCDNILFTLNLNVGTLDRSGQSCTGI